MELDAVDTDFSKLLDLLLKGDGLTVTGTEGLITFVNVPGTYSITESCHSHFFLSFFENVGFRDSVLTTAIMPHYRAAIKFILRFAADNFALMIFLFNYYKLIQHFVVKIPNRKSGKMTGFLLSSRAGLAIPSRAPKFIGDCHVAYAPRDDVFTYTMGFRVAALAASAARRRSVTVAPARIFSYMERISCASSP